MGVICVKYRFLFQYLNKRNKKEEKKTTKSSWTCLIKVLTLFPITKKKVQKHSNLSKEYSSDYLKIS